MSNNYSANNSEEIEINLIGLIWEILLRWKILIIAGLLTGAVVAGCKYFAQELVIAQDSVAAPDIKTRINELETKMMDIGEADDIVMVNQLLSRSASLRKTRDIYSTSFLMGLDEYNIRKLTVTYESVSNDNIVDLYSLSQSLSSSEFMSILSEIEGVDVSDAYLYILVSGTIEESTKESANDFLVIDFILLNDLDVNESVESLTGFLFDYEFANGKEGKDIIKLTDYSISEGYEKNIQDYKNSINKSYNAISAEANSIKTEMDALSDNAKNLIQLKMEDTGINYDGTVWNGVDSSETAGSSSSNKAFLIKFFCIGFFGGVFVYVCILFAKIMLAQKVGLVLENPMISSFPTFGNLVDMNYKRGNSFIFSPMIYKLVHRKDMNTDSEVNNIVSAMEYYSDAEGRENVTLVIVGSLSEKAVDLFDKVIEKWADKYNTTLTIELLSTTDADKAKLYEKISLIKGEVVLLLENNRTNLRDAENVIRMLSEKDVRIIGKVMLG